MKKKLGITIILLLAVCVLAYVYQTSPARCTAAVEPRLVEYGDIYAKYDEFELGENQYGMLVFKHPGQARQKALELCADVLEKIKKDYDLEFETDNPERIDAYLSYGDQMPGLSERECRQVGFLGTVAGICKHSKRDFYDKAGIVHLVPPPQ